MKIEVGLSPNCSEAVFRFYTLDPGQAREILQAFAKEVAGGNGHVAEDIPPIERIEEVEKVRFAACAGLGEPITQCHVEKDLGAFVLCIGNNDLSPEGEACATVKRLGIKVEEAETSPSLVRQYARDCTCGIVWFDGYAGRVVEKAR